MQWLTWVYLLMLVACSNTSTRNTYNPEYRPVIVFRANQNFKPDPSCQRLGRYKIRGQNLNQDASFYRHTIEKLKQLASSKGATHAKVVDHTDNFIYSEFYSCLQEYD